MHLSTLHVYRFLNMAIELVHFHSNNLCSPQMETNIGYVASSPWQYREINLSNQGGCLQQDLICAVLKLSRAPVMQPTCSSEGLISLYLYMIHFVFVFLVIQLMLFQFDWLLFPFFCVQRQSDKALNCKKTHNFQCPLTRHKIPQ